MALILLFSCMSIFLDVQDVDCAVVMRFIKMENFVTQKEIVVVSAVFNLKIQNSKIQFKNMELFAQIYQINL